MSNVKEKNKNSRDSIKCRRLQDLTPEVSFRERAWRLPRPEAYITYANVKQLPGGTMA